MNREDNNINSKPLVENHSANNKRLAKNTLLLYFRMFIVMALSIYISRIILKALGVVDFGIYNVVGGVVTIFTFVSQAMGNSTSRFITFALGKNDSKYLNNVFNASLTIHIALSILLLFAAETLGLWFFYEKMVIPSDRMDAAFWVYQFSVLTCMVSIIVVPYHSAVIAHEDMNVFAIISVVDILLRLGLAFSSGYFLGDRLIFYALVMFVIKLFCSSLYLIYNKLHYIESEIHIVKDKLIYKEVSSFAGWSLIGNFAWILYTQGLNILLNIFFGPAVNAARGIAVQVQSAVSQFVTSFQTALNPQITKSYALGDRERFKELVFYSSKISFYLLLCLALPLFICAEPVLQLWLGEVPEYSVSFVRLLLAFLLILPLENPLMTANCATGNIRVFQIFEGGGLLSILPIAYVFLKMGFSPNSAFVVQVLVGLIVQVIRVIIVKDQVGYSYQEYFFKIICRILPVLAIASLCVLFIDNLIGNGILELCVKIILMVIIIFCSSFLVGLSSQERKILYNKILKKK